MQNPCIICGKNAGTFVLLAMHYVAGESRSCAPFCFAAVVCLSIFTWLSTCCGTSDLFELCCASFLAGGHNHHPFFSRLGVRVALGRWLESLKAWGCSAPSISGSLSSWLRWRAVLFPFLPFVLAGVSSGDPPPGGQLLLSTPTGDDNTVFTSPYWVIYTQLSVSHVSKVLPPALDAVAGRWAEHLLTLCDRSELPKILNKNGCSKEAAKGICKHRGIIGSSTLLSSYDYSVVRVITRTAI